MRELGSGPSRGGDYHRPNQPWQCGLADEGPPCPMGPDAGGHCPHATACRPVRDGDRWRCNRSSLRGGPCADGPGPDGSCAIQFHCTPVRTLRSRRGRIVGAMFVAALGAVAMMLGGPWRNEWIAPGPLTHHHAQLLAAEGKRPGCAACHAAGDATVAAWWSHSAGGIAFETSQSALCLECHERDIAATATSIAHDWSAWPPGATDDPRGRRRDPHATLACSACHREHQGASYDLAAMDDVACQACHQQVYKSFATDHPDFGAWPYAAATGVAFDHASHANKHFVKERREFACGVCHTADATGAFQLTKSYGESCAACHDQALAVSLGDGIPLVALPMLDLDALADEGLDARPWPENATGDFEGTIPAPMQLLLAAEPEVAAALGRLGPRFDFFDLDPADAEERESAKRVIDGMRRLVVDLDERGHAAIGDRLAKAFGRSVSASELAALAAGLSPDTTSEVRRRWFPASASSGDRGTASSDRAALAARVAGGGWVRDDLAVALRYRPSGHDDAWMRAWLDAYAEAASGPRRAIAEPLLESALKPTSPGQCGSCHTARTNADGRIEIVWQAHRPGARRDGFASLTRFSHGPHLTDAKLRDCKACHTIGEPAQPLINAGSDVFYSPGANFAPLRKELCAECHVDNLAGASCTLCHAYHARDALMTTDAQRTP